MFFKNSTKVRVVRIGHYSRIFFSVNVFKIEIEICIILLYYLYINKFLTKLHQKFNFKR